MKISRYQACLIVLEARIQVKKVPSYRLGQGIMNLLPADLYKEITGTDKDFFHVRDDDKALSMFYEHCVEEE